MKQSGIIIFLALLLIYSCRNEDRKAKNEKGVQTQNEKVIILPWNAVWNEKNQRLELVRNPKSDISRLTEQGIINAINLRYPQIQLKYNGRRKDTVQVSIKDATFLTQNVGSTGAQTYLAEATFSLTELKGIHVVYFSFKEGDHAAPGAFSRKDFKGFN